MISADGGRRAVKSAKQHTSQVKTVLCAIDKGQAISSLWNKSLLITFLQSYAPEGRCYLVQLSRTYPVLGTFMCFRKLVCVG